MIAVQWTLEQCFEFLEMLQGRHLQCCKQIGSHHAATGIHPIFWLMSYDPLLDLWGLSFTLVVAHQTGLSKKYLQKEHFFTLEHCLRFGLPRGFSGNLAKCTILCSLFLKLLNICYIHKAWIWYTEFVQPKFNQTSYKSIYTCHTFVSTNKPLLFGVMILWYHYSDTGDRTL